MSVPKTRSRHPTGLETRDRCEASTVTGGPAPALMAVDDASFQGTAAPDPRLSTSLPPLRLRPHAARSDGRNLEGASAAPIEEPRRCFVAYGKTLDLVEPLRLPGADGIEIKSLSSSRWALGDIGGRLCEWYPISLGFSSRNRAVTLLVAGERLGRVLVRSAST